MEHTEQYTARFSFKQSPFYDVEEALAPTVELQGEVACFQYLLNAL